MTKKKVDVIEIYSDVKVIKNTVQRIEEQNNKDHNEIKIRQDKTNGSLNNHDNRIQKLEDFKKNKEVNKTERNWLTTTWIKIIAVLLVIIQLSFDVVILLKR